MSRTLRALACAIILFSFSGVAFAGTAFLTLETQQSDPALGGPDTWKLFLETGGDDDGASGWNITMSDFISGMNLAPRNAIPGLGAVSGFTVGVGDIPNAQTGAALFAGQNSTAPATIIYGIGNPNRTSGGPSPGLTGINIPAAGEPWGRIAIAMGTTADYQAVDIAAANVSLWNEGQAAINGTGAAPATVVLNDAIRTPFIPEPASFALFAIAAMGILGVRKRR